MVKSHEIEEMGK